MMKFPLFVDIKDKKIIVIGGGIIATRRIKTLLTFGACIQVIAPKITKELQLLFTNRMIEWFPRRYKDGDCHTAYMILSCTDDREVNHTIYLEAKEQKCYCNISDCKEECNFFFPGIATQGEIVVGVTASGTDHKVAREVTKQVRQVLEEYRSNS